MCVAACVFGLLGHHQHRHAFSKVSECRLLHGTQSRALKVQNFWTSGAPSTPDALSKMKNYPEFIGFTLYRTCSLTVECGLCSKRSIVREHVLLSRDYWLYIVNERRFLTRLFLWHEHRFAGAGPLPKNAYDACRSEQSRKWLMCMMMWHVYDDVT